MRSAKLGNHLKNDTKIFSAYNRKKNKNIQPRPEKQHSYKKKRTLQFREAKNKLVSSSYKLLKY